MLFVNTLLIKSCFISIIALINNNLLVDITLYNRKASTDELART